MACSHLIKKNLADSLQGKLIYKDECTKCFASSVIFTQKDQTGIDVCLKCFNGGCISEHSVEHAFAHGHPLAVNIRMQRKESPPSSIITKVAINKPGGGSLIDE